MHMRARNESVARMVLVIVVTREASPRHIGRLGRRSPFSSPELMFGKAHATSERCKPLKLLAAKALLFHRPPQPASNRGPLCCDKAPGPGRRGRSDRARARARQPVRELLMSSQFSNQPERLLLAAQGGP